MNTGRKYEEFAADVCLTARRTLTDPTEWAVFRFHYLLGADWKLCGRQLGMDKGTFFHAAYRVEEKLGKVWATLKPYALYPLDEYFSACTRRADVRPFLVHTARYRNGVPLRPPFGERPVAAPAPDPFEAVKEGIRAAYSQGQTLTEIGNDLNRRGVLPKRAARWYPALVLKVVLQVPREQRAKLAA